VKSIIGECKQVTIKKKNPRTALKKIAEISERITKGGAIYKYLEGRGVKPSPKLREAMLYYWEDGVKLGPFPTMVSLVTDSEGVGVTYHLTYTHRGIKAKVASPRKIMTPITTVTGCAVKLHNHGDHICIAEGIETALAAHNVCGLPAFSALNANCLEKFNPPKGIKKVDIFGDNDASFCGQKSAYALAERLVKQGIVATVHIPGKVGNDWLDELGGEK
jgi:putative DNA primase/helicase